MKKILNKNVCKAILILISFLSLFFIALSFGTIITSCEEPDYTERDKTNNENIGKALPNKSDPNDSYFGGGY